MIQMHFSWASGNLSVILLIFSKIKWMVCDEDNTEKKMREGNPTKIKLQDKFAMHCSVLVKVEKQFFRKIKMDIIVVEIGLICLFL